MKKLAMWTSGLALCAATMAYANDDLVAQMENSKQWAIQTGDYKNQRYSKLDQINADNVGDLQVAWTFSTGVLRGHEGSPLVIGDTMFVHTPFPNIVYALDVIPVMCCDTVNRGVAYAEGKIILHQADTKVVALDAKTGAVVWEVLNGDPAIGETNTATVLPVKDKVIVGISGGEFGVRGSVTAYDLNTGAQVWRAYSMGPDSDILADPVNTTHLGKPVGADSGLNTWEGDQWMIGGGTTWGWYSADLEENLMYYGTGNPSTWNPAQRPGDNRWSMTVMARDIDTGMAKWFYQMTPHDEWDFDGINEMILTEQEIDGVERKLLTHFDRNGLGYTMDRVSGELLVAEKFDPVVNWTTGVDMDPNSENYGRPAVVAQYSPEQNGEDVNSTGICPAALGTKDQQPAAYSQTTFAWTMSHSACPIQLVSLTLVRLLRCILLLKATAVWVTSSLGTTQTVPSNGPSLRSSQYGPVLWQLLATSCSTAHLRVTSKPCMPKQVKSFTASKHRPASLVT